MLTATLQLLRATLPPDQQACFGDIIAGDTLALLAWVRENNPKQYIKEGRLDKTRQPSCFSALAALNPTCIAFAGSEQGMAGIE